MRIRSSRLLLLVGVALGACSTPPPPTTGEATRTAAATTSAPASASASAVASDPTAASTTPVSEDPPALTLQPLGEGLVDPISITATPDGWLLVNERGGMVIAVDAETGEQSVAADLTDRVLGQGEQGLLGLALHPGWPDVARAFIHYTDLDGNTVLSEFVGDDGDRDGTPTIDAASEKVLLRVEQPYPNHNGGQLAFGPDGYLYMALGDGGAADDPHDNGQNPNTLLGTILRLDTDQPGSVGIPDDNPFASGGGGAPEVYLLGLRNPWRFSFDRETGMLWIADVGQNAFEEINRVDPVADARANLGWNVMEASHCFAAADCSTDGLTLPLAEYGRGLGCSVTGGHVYRGEAVPELKGWYLFSDYCTGTLFGIRADAPAPDDGTALAPRVLLETGLQVSSFGEGADGEMYVADLDGGAIYRIVAAP